MTGDNDTEDQWPPDENALAPAPEQPAIRQNPTLVVLPVIGRSGVTRHCWEVIQAPDNSLHGNCDECYAYFVQRDCWTLWALRDAGHKPCCQKQADCAKCPVLLNQIAPKTNETVQVRARPPARPAPLGRVKQVCSFLDVVDVPVPPDSAQYLSAVSRAVQARNSTFRCRLRGVHLDAGYVGDMCVSRHVQDCVFLEEAQPVVQVQRHGDDLGKTAELDADDEVSAPSDNLAVS